MKRIFLTAIKWLVSLALLAYALQAINLNQMSTLLAGQSLWIPIAVVALQILQMLISTFRWQRIIALISGVKLHYANVMRLNFISVFFNNCLPGTIGGDVVRAVMLKSEHVPLKQAFHSVIFDRLIAVFGIILLMLLTLPWLAQFLPTLPLIPTYAASFVAITAGIFVALKLPLWLSRMKQSYPIRVLRDLSADMRTLLLSATDFAIMNMQAVIAHSCYCFAIYLMAESLGAPIAWSACLALVPPVLLLAMLPISIGGWGVRELSMVGFLALANVPEEVALAISVEFGLLTIIASLPGAYYYATRRKPARENAGNISPPM